MPPAAAEGYRRWLRDEDTERIGSRVLDRSAEICSERILWLISYAFYLNETYSRNNG
jgi:hypothetical protein